MRFLQIGLGSMGKRRIRCLKKLGFNNIVAFDVREDRKNEVSRIYGVETVDNISKIDYSLIDACIISTPPDKHEEFIVLALNNNIPAFVEASVVLGSLEKLNKIANKKNVFIAPSCTLKFHPAIEFITKMVKNKRYGKVTNFSYHSGQYLPDWHSYEKVKDFYVSKNKTGAAREIVSFELTWLTELVGMPLAVEGFYGKTMDVGANIDDTYALAMEFKNKAYGVMNVDVVSRYATRSLILNLESAQILWKWNENKVKLYEAKKNKWIEYCYSLGETAKGYNKNIGENMYVDELAAFIKAIKKKEIFPNTLNKDIAILKILENISKE